ncbi:MAG: divalent-cation tolerance protein CutA [Rhodocyclaceae bacterium]|jgi:periplasmic divalent cation tolerance protein|nr:divalent-cation tolerance protein CutA [Rhodocyclaceae bacterium]MCL4758659.1 divalent-cation tolerance protein CutA [Rhodocyclaceae bacterium]
MSEALIVLTNLPDPESAERLASELVARRLAACVNILAPCRSVYRWKGEVESAQEVPLLIKCPRSRYTELECAIRKAHPYELPEIVAVPVERGLPEYLGWIAEQCTDGAPDAPCS